VARFRASVAVSPAVFKVTSTVRSNMDVAQYTAAFNRIQHYIHEGDCYQVNLAQRFSAQVEGDAWAAYCRLRNISPAPFAAYLNLPDVQILSASPERFLQVRRGQVETRPIKGTRPRSDNAAQDRAYADELLSSLKDRAENLMIVDLLRNDIGKNCAPGTVRVPNLFELESFSNVHHMVSTITGKLAPGHTAMHLLRGCFPGGSITGAPKLRAMEIIEELEPHRRGVYCSAIGYIGFDGNMDTNIAIRTAVVADGEISFYAGGGIVADSEADKEYRETWDKAANMLELIKQTEGDGHVGGQVGRQPAGNAAVESMVGGAGGT
jgi:para-aminobenzoate synthetase component I